MRSEFPNCYSVPLSHEGEISIPLQEVLPADCMLVQIADNKDNISAAIESIVAVVSLHFNVRSRQKLRADVSSLHFFFILGKAKE